MIIKTWLNIVFIWPRSIECSWLCLDFFTTKPISRPCWNGSSGIIFSWPRSGGCCLPFHHSLSITNSFPIHCYLFVVWSKRVLSYPWHLVTLQHFVTLIPGPEREQRCCLEFEGVLLRIYFWPWVIIGVECPSSAFTLHGELLGLVCCGRYVVGSWPWGLFFYLFQPFLFTKTILRFFLFT